MIAQRKAQRFPKLRLENPLRGGKGLPTSYREEDIVIGQLFSYDSNSIFRPYPGTNSRTGIVHAYQTINWGKYAQYRTKKLNRKKIKVHLGEGGWQLCNDSSWLGGKGKIRRPGFFMREHLI